MWVEDELTRTAEKAKDSRQAASVVDGLTGVCTFLLVHINVCMIRTIIVRCTLITGTDDCVYYVEK